MLNKRKERKTSLSISAKAVYVSNKQSSPLMLPLLCLISLVFMYCLIEIAAKSFNIFESVGIGKYDSEISGNQLKIFWTTALVGCGIISFVIGLKKHSVKISLGLIAALLIFFGYNYKLVANGFIRAFNKVLYSVYYAQGQTEGLYYQLPFQSSDSVKELEIFCLAVIWTTCFLVACAAVKYCNPVILAACLALYSAPALAYFTFRGEAHLVAAAMCCLLILVVRVSGYRGFEINSRKSRFSRTYKICGRVSSQTAVQQTLGGLLAIVIIMTIITSLYDVSEYERDENVDRLSRDITQSVQNLGTSGFGFGTGNGLNNGQIYNTGNLQYTGETMFKLRNTHNPLSSPIYLRAYTAGDYDGKRWSELTRKTYRTQSDIWEAYNSESFYPQFMYGYLYDIISPKSRKYSMEIVNENINSRIFLTSPNLLVSGSTELSTAKTSFDNAFITDSLSGLASYKQSVIYTNPSNYIIYIDAETIGATIYDTLYNGSFYPSLDDSIMSSDKNDDLIENLSKFYSSEEQYRKFVVENYTSYPEIIDEIFPSGIDLEECYNSSKTSTGYTLGGGDIDSYIYSFDGEYIDISEVPNTDIIYTYYQKVISQIRDYIQSQAEYTLSPGGTPYGKDFVDYFLNENHKGYCVHFATAATLMLRKAGIPARYVEGYYVSSTDQKNTDDNGYISVPDSRAHAWTEVYIPLLGWTVVDFTPSYGTDEDVPAENDAWDTESDSDTGSDTESDEEDDTDSSMQSSDSDTSTDRRSTDTKTDNSVSLSTNAKTALSVIGIAAAIIALWILTRYTVLYIRRKKFNSADTRKAAAHMYSYSLRLLKAKGITPNNDEGEQAFAKRVSRELNFDDRGRFCDFTNAVLSARFGRTAPKKKKAAEMNAFIEDMSNYIITSSSKRKNFIMKYFLFLK